MVRTLDDRKLPLLALTFPSQDVLELTSVCRVRVVDIEREEELGRCLLEDNLLRLVLYRKFHHRLSRLELLESRVEVLRDGLCGKWIGDLT